MVCLMVFRADCHTYDGMEDSGLAEGGFLCLLAMTDGVSLDSWLQVAERVLTMWNYLA